MISTRGEDCSTLGTRGFFLGCNEERQVFGQRPKTREAEPETALEKPLSSRLGTQQHFWKRQHTHLLV